jgi:hypothetical protein
MTPTGRDLITTSLGCQSNFHHRILRAAMRDHRLQPSVDPAAGLPDEALEGVADAQERYNLV